MGLPKKDFVDRYGAKAYEEAKRRNNEACQRWREENPDQVNTNSRQQCNKGGRYYEDCKRYNNTGLRHERNSVRSKHQNQYRPYKKIIASGSQLHHEWIPETADYRGIALVEADQHMHGIINVIHILEGEITLFTEAEVSAALGPC